ncbi:myoneurin-like isoform X3 [Pieris napi]|uniref:myoneurin-like isoform X3 n=1 Tax=Pieris napi TaxID=78633 RepID=UPI001FBAE74F|nr:myoneurin-like isoform X3 [Pieris napi]
MEDEEDFIGCVSCMSTNDLCDLFAIYTNNDETYAQMFETCFEFKISNDFKYICAVCVDSLEKSLFFKNQTTENIRMLQTIKNEEYLDEAILEEGDSSSTSQGHCRNSCHKKNGDDLDDVEIEALDETTCIYCNLELSSPEEVQHHIRLVHGLEPRTGKQVRECNLCGASLRDLPDHFKRCHSGKEDNREYACHFCENIYKSKKACFTHLRMKHGYFLLYKSAIQEETKYRFRKTTASKQTIEGVRSHYMCSQSGIYVYQGKGKRPAPERQIYKTGKACPAHMIVTETLDKVLVTFYKTHVGHGPCPYYEPREPKRLRTEADTDNESLICDTCGAKMESAENLHTHVTAHGLQLYPCEYCHELFQNVDAWNHHRRREHNYV